LPLSLKSNALLSLNSFAKGKALIDFGQSALECDASSHRFAMFIVLRDRRLTQTPYSSRSVEQLSFGRAHYDFDAAIWTLLFD